MSDNDHAVLNEPVIDLHSVSFGENIRITLQDLIQGTAKWRLNWNLGLLDIKLRYRGSILGPFWITITTAVMVSTMGFLYAYLFNTNIKEYLPFISISIVLWGYVSSVFIEGCSIFTSSESLILSMHMPFSIYAWRMIIRNFLILVHNLLVIIVVFTIFHVVPYTIYLIIPAVLLWTINSLALSLLLGTLGTRFRDIPQIIASLVQVLFFITPIIWKPSLLTVNQDILFFNPLYPLFEIIRAPILGGTISSSIWLAAIGYSVFLWIAALLIFSKTRTRISYWM